MNTKKLIAAIVLGLFTVPAFASAYTYAPGHYPKATETLVEGHTVFAVVQATICIDEETDRIICPGGSDDDFDISYDVRANLTLQRLGTAVAVLVRDRVKEVTPPPMAPECATNRDVVLSIFYENPGVLWFNDQFLVGDDLDIVEADVDANVDVCTKQSQINFNPNALTWRYPCGGWVWATQAGNPDPRGVPALLWSYQESYHIVDPNDKVWVIDKYGPVNVGIPPTAIDQQVDLGLDHDSPYPYDHYDYDDVYDGDLRAVVGQQSAGAAIQYYLGGFNLWTVPLQGTGTCMTAGADPYGPTSTQTSTPYTDMAVHNPVYSTFYSDPDGPSGPKHLENVKYNAVLFFFFEDLVEKGGKIHGTGAANDGDLSFCQAGTDEWDCGTGRGDDSEGNSHPYNSASLDSGPTHIHPTASVDLYYHNVAPPGTGPKRYAVYDTTGGSAPRHSHTGSGTFDDRMDIDNGVCADADWHDTHQSYTYNGAGTWSGSYDQTSEEAVGYGNGNDEGDHGPWEDNTGECTGGYDGGVTGAPDEYY